LKGFWGTFGICFVLCLIVTYFLAGILVSSIWAVIAVISLVLAALITVLVNQSTRIEALEKTVKELQGVQEQPDADQ